MILLRKCQERGITQTDWLNSQHSFSFGDYYDPNNMGFSCLRVINEDRVEPGKGFDWHAHKDMEIISFVIEGALAHEDNLGNASVLKAGEVQLMSAGKGIKHREYNESLSQPVHFLQMWIKPDNQDLLPHYQQQKLPLSRKGLHLIISKAGTNHSLKIQQDVQLYFANLFPAEVIHYIFANNRRGWLQLITGTLAINSIIMHAGDGAAISDKQIEIQATSDAKFLLFDLPEI